MNNKVKCSPTTMSTFKEQVMTWKSLITDAFKPKTFKKWRQLMLDILVVDSGFKPGLLWDYATLPRCRLQQLLTTALGLGLLVSSLAVVSIEQDVMVLNLQSLRIRPIPANQIKAVDVGWNNGEPKHVTDSAVLDPTLRAYGHVVEDGLSDVTLREELVFNPTTLFGLLLGYPVVYWYSMENGEARNCLGHEPLIVYKVVGRLERGFVEGEKPFMHTVYSFSVPECIVSGDKENSSTLVSDWYRNVRDSRSWSSVFSSVTMEEERVSLPSVCL